MPIQDYFEAYINTYNDIKSTSQEIESDNDNEELKNKLIELKKTFKFNEKDILNKMAFEQANSLNYIDRNKNKSYTFKIDENSKLIFREN